MRRTSRWNQGILRTSYMYYFNPGACLSLYNSLPYALTLLDDHDWLWELLASWPVYGTLEIQLSAHTHGIADRPLLLSKCLVNNISRISLRDIDEESHLDFAVPKCTMPVISFESGRRIQGSHDLPRRSRADGVHARAANGVGEVNSNGHFGASSDGSAFERVSRPFSSWSKHPCRAAVDILHALWRHCS